MLEAIWSLRVYFITPVVLAGYSLTCLGAGLIFLRLILGRPIRIEGVSAGTSLATAFILGEGILASTWLLLALKGWLSFTIVAVVCFVFGVGAFYFGRSIFAAFIKQLVLIWRELCEDTWGWQLIAGLTIILCLLWITSLGRPLREDGTAFYLALGKFIAASHRLVLLPGYENFTSIGLQGELHFAALMVLHGPEAAKLFSWPTVIAAGIILAALARVTGMSRRGQWLTLGILFSSSAVVWLSGDGKVDLFAAAFGVAAYYWAIQIRFQRSGPVFFITGILSGYAIIAKLSYVFVIVPSVAFLVFWGFAEELRANQDIRRYLKLFANASLLILLGLVVAFVPHLIKNGVLFHNALLPIGSNDTGWLKQTWFGPEVTRRILLTYPLALTYGSYWAQYGNMSPLILAFLPLVYYLPRARPFFSNPLLVTTTAALVGLMIWILYSPSVLSPRYILATLLLLILLPARSAEYISLHDQKPRLLAAAVTFFTIISLLAAGLYFLEGVFFPGVSVQYFMHTIDECDRDGEYCEAMRSINRDAQPGDRVFLASYQRYWLRGDLLQCVSSQDDLMPFGANADEIWLNLYRGGFKYLFLDKATHSSIIEGLDLDQVPQWVELTSLFEREYLIVYRVKYVNPSSSVEPALCQISSSGPAWEVVYP